VPDVTTATAAPREESLMTDLPSAGCWRLSPAGAVTCVLIPSEPSFQERMKKALKTDFSITRIMRRHAGPTRP
jgi:hypothetical protein